MSQLPPLISDLTLILLTAGITMLLFKKLKQPLVLGYILAGALVSPNFTLFPSVSDPENTKVWAEIGVIFLLFSLGLDFSFKKLMQVGGGASITAITEVSIMLILGYLTGLALGWSQIDSMFLGGILSISSTTIIIRAFDELGVKSSKFAGLVFGVLIVEDMVAILILVLLSTIAISHHVDTNEMMRSIFSLSFFLGGCFLAGIFIIPTVLRLTRKLMSDEMLLVVSLAFCLVMVALATKAGFSPALGAFVMGSIFAETIAAEKIQRLVTSVKDLFGAVFFVSVGMLIDHQILVEYAGPVLLISLVTMFGKTFGATLGALISGEPLKNAMQTGVSLAQIGEFSFIIATLGLTLKVTSDFLYPIAVAVSAVTTFVTPYLIRYSEPAHAWLEKRLPVAVRDGLANYSSGAKTISQSGHWNVVLKAYATIILTNLIVILGVLFLIRHFSPQIRAVANNSYTEVVVAIVSMLVLAPFLWALAAKKIENMSYKHLWIDNKFNKGPLIVIEVFRILLAITLVVMLLDILFATRIALIAAIVIVLICATILPKYLQAYYVRIKQRFLSNLNSREVVAADPSELIPWDTHLATFDILPEANCAGKTLQELGLRELFSVNVAMIERGKKTIKLPGKDEQLFPGDHITVTGGDEQLLAFREFIDRTEDEPELTPEEEEVTLRPITIEPGSFLFGKTIGNSGIREEASGMVVGIERNNERIMNPGHDFKFDIDDVVWVVGERRKVRAFVKKNQELTNPTLA